MKALLFVSTLLLTGSAFAGQIQGAQIVGGDLKIDVAYGGGCKEHKFELELQGCAETMPVQCQANLKHTTPNGPDFCEAYIHETVTISLADAGLTGAYYSNGSLTINGDADSKATVVLPASSGDEVQGHEVPTLVSCTTHTGSALVIDLVQNRIKLQTVRGEQQSSAIVGQQIISLESLPPIEQRTLKLGDGRSLVIQFRDGSQSGTGQFIRLDSSRSPEFSCSK